MKTDDFMRFTRANRLVGSVPDEDPEAVLADDEGNVILINTRPHGRMVLLPTPPPRQLRELARQLQFIADEIERRGYER